LVRAAKKAGADVPVELAASIMVGLLQGLHAAHIATDEKGRPLGLVHRDVSPHNVLVGTDGVARVLDFGIAKVVQGRASHGDTDPGVLKGKFSYMAPELIQGAPPSRQSDVFSAAVVFWELLTGAKLFQGVNDQERLLRVVKGDYPRARRFAPHVSEVVDRIVMRGLELDPARRHEHALAMAIELESAVPLASQRVVGEWVSRFAADVLAQRTELMQEVEASTISLVRWSAPPPPDVHAVSATPPGVDAPTPSVLAGKPKQRLPGWLAVAGSVALALVLAFTLARSPNPKPVSRTTAQDQPPQAPAAAPPRPEPPNAAESAVNAAPPHFDTPPAPPAAAPTATTAAPASSSGHAPSAKAPGVKANTHGTRHPHGDYLPNEL
ncbi:MAG TPA: serine/threonine-protein kinase, partial [Polyangiaceae bacterium]|nr:serine/threonine-protein kinase [Polyangiaceae bacterium]